MFNIWSNGSVKELVDTFKGKDIIPEITTIENLKDTLNILLDKLLAERGDKLVIFVDELDRCNPLYAIKLLERIKNFLDIENIIFVILVWILGMSIIGIIINIFMIYLKGFIKVKMLVKIV